MSARRFPISLSLERHCCLDSLSDFVSNTRQGTWLASHITHDWDFHELFWPQVLRGFGLMMAMIPINNISLGTLPPERVKNASGLYNLTRNVGGAVGRSLFILTRI